MKEIELHRAKRLHSGGTLYQQGQSYKVVDKVAKHLLTLKDANGVPYFRVPLTPEQAAAEAAKARDPRTNKPVGDRLNGGANVVKVEDVVKPAPVEVEDEEEETFEDPDEGAGPAVEGKGETSVEV
jgi:hypothetical protein